MARGRFDHGHRARSRAAGMVVFSDEVYRELEHDPAPAAGRVRRVRAGRLARQRLQELRPAGPADRLARARDRPAGRRRELKDYTTICRSAPSEFLVALALRHARKLLDRNPRIVRATCPLRRLLRAPPGPFEWMRPTASPIGFPRVTGSVTARWCSRSPSKPACCCSGSVYDQPDHVRIGFGRADLPAALARLDEHLG